MSVGGVLELHSLQVCAAFIYTECASDLVCDIGMLNGYGQRPVIDPAISADTQFGEVLIQLEHPMPSRISLKSCLVLEKTFPGLSLPRCSLAHCVSALFSR